MTFRQKVLLAVILGVSFFLSLSAVNYALPLRFFGDEYIHVANALKMLEQKTLFLNFSYLPPLFAYLLMPFILLYGALGMIFGVFQGLGGFKETVILHSEDLLIFSRFLGAVFGLATIYLIFKWTKELFNPASGFLAAIILALLPLHLQESQAGRFWLPMSFFILAAAYAIQQLAQTGRARWYYWSAILIGLGYGLGLVAIILIPWYLLAHWRFIKQSSNRFFDRKLIISFILLLIIIGFFTLANTYTVFRQFGRGVGTILDMAGINIVVPQSSQHFLDNNFIAVIGRIVKIIWSNFYGQVVLLIIAGVGLIGQKKYWQNFGNFFLIVWPLTYLIGLAVVFNIILDRYTLPALVFFVPPTAYGLYLLFEKVKAKKYLWPMILIIFLLPQIYFTYQYSERILKTNTLIQAKNWLEKNIAADKKIVLDECPWIYLTANQESLRFQKNNSPFFLDTRSKLLLDTEPDQYPKPSYFVYDFSHLDLSKLEPADFTADYYLVCFWDKQRDLTGARQDLLNKYQFKLTAEFYPTKEKYRHQEIGQVHNGTVGALKYLRQLDRLGPKVEIYQLVLNK